MRTVPLESSRHTRSAALSPDAYLSLFRSEVCCARYPPLRHAETAKRGGSGVATCAPGLFNRASVQPRGPATGSSPVRFHPGTGVKGQMVVNTD